MQAGPKFFEHLTGTTAKQNYDLRKQWHEAGRPYLHEPITDEELLEQVKVMYDHDNQMKALVCINCWNKCENESAALWKIYADFNKGIMIKSSIQNLHAAFANNGKQVALSEIRYMDYRKETMLDGNSNYLIIHKQKAYSYEEEVRLIYSVIPEIGWVYNWEEEEVQEGKYIDIDLNLLIDEIVISPFAPAWFFKLVEDIMYKYELSKPINKSELSLA